MVLLDICKAFHCIPCELLLPHTAWKVSKYEVFSGPYFPAFGLNTEKHGVYLRIQSECRKIRTRTNSVFGQFSRSDSWMLMDFIAKHWKLFNSYLKGQKQSACSNNIYRYFLETLSDVLTASILAAFLFGILLHDSLWFINPFHQIGLILYPLKTSENLWFSVVFRGYAKRSVVWNELRKPFYITM